MLTLKIIVENTQIVLDKLAKKNFHAKDIIIELVKINKKRKFIQHTLDINFFKLKTFSQSIKQLIKKGEIEKIKLIQKQIIPIKENNKQLELKKKKKKKKKKKIIPKKKKKKK